MSVSTHEKNIDDISTMLVMTDSPYRALETAAIRCDFSAFKAAIRGIYTPRTANATYHKTVADYYPVALREADVLMDATSEEDIRRLQFYASVCEAHESTLDRAFVNNLITENIK